MAYSERINPKTGEKEYKVRYYFMRSGKKRDSETAWFTSLPKAQEEAKKLKTEKEKEDIHNRKERRDKTLGVVFELYIQELKENMIAQKSTTYRKLYYTAKSMCEKYMPAQIYKTRICDIETLTFKQWQRYINKQSSIGGLYMRTCRDILYKFNTWLADNNFYNDEYAEDNIRITLQNAKIKSKETNNKENDGKRNIITMLEIDNIGKYYLKKGLGSFSNFYYFTLFHVLFYSGIRVEELCALQWKFIDLNEGSRTISIKNSISHHENINYALYRVKHNEYKTKNSNSIRVIPIFDYIYGLLLDYKESFKYEYDIDSIEIEECFVFPHLSSKHNPHDFFRSWKILKELHEVTRELGIENTDLQMFRHSCATFLILPPPEGLGYVEEKVKDYFGHQDTTMLNTVYGKLNSMQKTARMKNTFKDIYKPKPNENMDSEDVMKMQLIAKIRGDNEESITYRRARVYAQIEKAIYDNKINYCYNSRDERFIKEYIEEHDDDEINFILLE